MPGSPPDPSRNLLFGLIALQVGLIDQSKLVAAFQAWTLEKSRLMSDLLVSQGALDADDRTAIDAMVARHLAKHGGDPEKSLAAIHAGPSTRLSLLAVGDADLDASLARVGPSATASDDGGTDAFRTRLSAVGTATSDGLRFRVLRPHARGGLGEVFVALDGELHREVALKQILEDHAHEQDSRQRFLIEAEITGGLEHPGIVPVYGLGAYSDGRPYYAMRFIQGDSLKDAITRFHHTVESAVRTDPPAMPDEERMVRTADPTGLGLRKLLRRFLDVCNAVHYAHARGVLHRDLKPANIIVGKYGETLVVDWGLAKAKGRIEPESSERPLIPSSTSDIAETLPGSALGTPAYMSPEQARGDLDRLDARSDVYSLGATLYHVLTGKPPFAGVVEILRAVERGEFVPPRRLDPSLDPALEAVCLKAMALRPDDRYPSVKALADDVDRWLADEPTIAFPEPFTRRARRWMKRHRTAVTASAASVLVALVGLASVLAVQTRAQADLQAKNGVLSRLNTALLRANTEVEAKNGELARSVVREQERFDLAQQAIKSYTDGVREDETLKNPNLGALRAKLLKRSQEFYLRLEDLLKGQTDTRSLSALASAYFDLGSLTAEIGDKKDALASYEQARAIWERLARENPAVAMFQSDLANSHNNIGLLQRATGQPEAALRSSEQARAIRERLAQENPAVTQFQSHLAQSHNNIGNFQSETGQPEAALRSYEQARAIREGLARENPAVTEFQSDLARSHNNIGILQSDTGQPEAALRSFEQARAIREGLARENPAVTMFQRDLAESHNDIGILLRATGQLEAALRSSEQARAIQERLAREHPEAPDYASALGGTLDNLALIDIDAKRFQDAFERLTQAIVWQKKALATNRKNPQYRQFLANHLTNLITAARGLGRDAEVTRAQRELDELKANDPRFAALDARLAAVAKGEAPKNDAERMALAQRAYDLGRHAAAARLWAEALEADPKLGDDRQAQPRYNAACAAALAAAGKAKDDPPSDEPARAKLRAQALGWLKAELTVWSKLVESGPPQAKAFIAQTLQHWQEDTDLAGIRDAWALDALPESERVAWRELWANVDALLAKARATATLPPAPELPADPFAR